MLVDKEADMPDRSHQETADLENTPVAALIAGIVGAGLILAIGVAIGLIGGH